MNTDEIKVLENLAKAASNLPLPELAIRDKVWSKISDQSNIIEVDSFRYLALACAVAAIITLFFSVDIMNSIQNTVAWEISDQVVNILN